MKVTLVYERLRGYNLQISNALGFPLTGCIIQGIGRWRPTLKS